MVAIFYQMMKGYSYHIERFGTSQNLNLSTEILQNKDLSIGVATPEMFSSMCTYTRS